MKLLLSLRTRLLVGALILGVALPVAGQGVIDRDHVPSEERIDRFERRRDNVDGNNLRATITNWAQTAQSGNPGDFWYEWPKNTNRIYISLTQLWVGSPVQGVDGGSGFIVDVADFRSNPSDDTESWTFQPIEGYVNPAGSALGIAQSDEFESWPPFWPDKLNDESDPGWIGSWNGLFGKNVFNADQEFFYKVGDDEYDRLEEQGGVLYLPDTTDLSRRGLGLITEVRILAWSQILIDDVIFLLHAIKNDGTEDLPQVGVAIWLADCVGGDCQDDVPFFDLQEDVAFMTDADGVGDQNFGSDPVGSATIAFLETPGNATDRIDNDGDGSTSPDCVPFVGECNSPIVPASFLTGEDETNGIDDNGNGLVDENTTHIPFTTEAGIDQLGVGYADYIDNDGDGEENGPIVTQDMVDAASGDIYNRWPPGEPHLIGVGSEDLGRAFRDGIDNDESAVTPTANYPYLSEEGSPTVTQAMVDAAAGDAFKRYTVPGTSIVLYDVGPEDLGKPYADGVDNDEDGAIDEGIDEGIDEMIDESRSDGIDNDRDWNPLQHDVGLDGVGFNGDPGDGDGVPTTGAGTDFPGERNIDITDISESDQIGITNVQGFPSGALSLGTLSDQRLFNTYLKPGDFDTERPPPGDNDLTVSSGLFPLVAGQTERISLSIQLGGSDEESLQARDFALQAYQEDYQFAQAPITPTVSAVPGDGRVTLYWDSDAEDSFDQFLAGLGRDPNDFEGYRIYRATDAAFLDALTITDGFGNTVLRKPIAQFDLIDEFEGFHPVDINGVKFYLGNNKQDPGEDGSGLAHTFVDSTVTNGIRYFYAVTAYDYGSAIDNIPPTETPIRIQRLPDGSIRTGPNVIEVTPSAPVAGYERADLVDLTRVEGATTSLIDYRIVDPTVLKPDNRYRIIFEDTLIVATNDALPDTLTTKNFSLIDLATGDTLLLRSTAFRENEEFPVFDRFGNPLGFELFFFPEDFIELNQSASGWNSDEIFPASFDRFNSSGFLKGLRNPADYRVEIVGPSQGMSTELQVRGGRRPLTLPARPTNVNVFRIEPDGTEVPVNYAFWDLTGDDFVAQDATDPATFTADSQLGESDFIILIEPQVGSTTGDEIVTWRIGLNFTSAFSDRRDPQQGDVLTLVTRKPFLSPDAFEFTVKGPDVDEERAGSALDDIRVVPNPYVATNRFEPLNPFSSGRGPRRIHFTHLPPEATVRIFTASGRLVRTLRLHEGSNGTVSPDDLLDGTLEWDLQTEDNLTVSYGLYIYHVEAPGIGETSGTFAIIK